MSYYPSQLSPRDNYLAALARAKAAEEEYFAAEAIDQEERQIRHRLKELEFQRRKASHLHYPSYGAPLDRLSLLRLQLQEEERKQAEAELIRRRELQSESALVALQLDRERRERAQLQLLLEQRSTEDRFRPWNRTPTRNALDTYATIPAFKARPSRHIHSAIAHPPHARPEANPFSSNADLEDVLHALFGRKPSSSPRHYEARTPTKAERKPVAHAVDTAAAIEQFLKAIFPHADLHSSEIAPTANTSTPVASCSKEKNPAPTAPTVPSKPVVQESASSPFPSTDAVIDLQQVLRNLFGDAVQAYTPHEGQQAVPPQEKPRPEVQRPTSPVSSLKEQLEARLASEETTEVKDTIQAIFNSLSDANISVPSPAPSSAAEASTSLSKGKAKAQLTLSTNTESEDLAVSLARVNSIETAYRSLVDEFTFPSHLDFTPSPSPASSDTEQSLITKLAYTARNAPVRFHEQSLSGLLSQLDSIESFGDESLRAKRKEVVGLVEGALEDLEREVEGRWRVKVAKDNVAANADVHVEAPTSLEEDFAVESSPSAEPARASATGHTSPDTTVPVVGDHILFVSEGQAASSPISASPEVVAPLDIEEPAIEDAQEALEEDVSSDETELSTDIESSADSLDDVEPDTFGSGSTLPESSTASVATLKPGDGGQSMLRVINPSEGKVSDEGSDWSEVEA